MPSRVLNQLPGDGIPGQRMYRLPQIWELARTDEVREPHPEAEGIAFRVGWASLAKSPDLLDRMVATARRSQLPYSIRLQAGYQSPAGSARKWVTHIEGRDNPNKDPVERLIPVPWEPGHKRLLRRMLRAIAREYRADPLLRAMHIPGTRKGAELHYAEELRDVDGYSDGAMAWCSIEAGKVLRNNLHGWTSVVLNYSPEPFSDEVEHYCRHHAGYACQWNSLAAKTSPRYESVNVVRRWSELGMVAGAQTVSPSSNQQRWQGEMGEAMDLAYDLGLTYVEHYRGDIEAALADREAVK